MKLERTEFIVKKLEPSHLDEVLDLTWRVFLEFEAPEYGPEGINTFYDEVVKGKEFKEACENGNNTMWGAFVEEKLVGTIVIKKKSHLTLVFVDKHYHRMGIASTILQNLIESIKQEQPNIKRITVNSSPFGKAFYRQCGFHDTESEQVVNGIKFTPMELILE